MKIKSKNIFEKLDIPRPGLKLLVDPAEQLGTANGEKLGPNLVKNGDFRDFTMGSVAAANLKGHWIFNDEAVRQKSHPIGDRYMADGTVIGNGYHRILAASATDFNIGTGDFSLAFSVCVGTIGGGTRKGIFCKSGNSGLSSKGIAVWLTESNALRVNIADGSGTAYYFDTTASGAFTTGDWIRAVISVDRNGVQFLHVNGILKAIQAVTNTADITDNAQDLLIGAATGGAQTPWTGQYDECAYFNRALSINEAERYSKGHLPPSPVGHWKFDSSITANNVTDKSGNGHTVDPISMTYVSGKTRSIAQDWSQGGAIWTGNLVSESSPNASEFTDNGTTWWTASRGTFSHNSGTQDATFTVTDDTGQLRIEKTGIITQGTRVRVSFRAKSAHTTSKMSLNGESAYFADVLEVANPNLSSSYQEYIFEGYVGSANKLTIIFPDDLVNGQSVTIDSIKCQKIGGVGNHLIPAGAFDVGNQFIDSAPNYKNGNALYFNRGNYLKSTSTDFNPGTANFSLVAKVRLDETATLSGRIICCGGSTMRYDLLWYHATNKFRFDLVLSGTGYTVYSTDTVEKGVDYFICITVDRADVVKMYYAKMGDPLTVVTSASIAASSAVDMAGLNNFTIGEYSASKGNGWEGSKSEIGFWNKNLSESEVKQAYGLANGFYYSDGSGAGTYASIFTNENFTQKMVNGANPAQIISQVISGVNASKLYKIVVEATIQNSKQMYIRANNVSATDVIYTGDGNKRVYESYWKGDKPGSAISTLQLFNWNSSAEITFEKVAVHEVLTEGVSNLVEDFSKGGVVYGPNILLNSSFENSFANWGEYDPSGTLSLSFVTNPITDGEYSLKAVDTQVGYTGAFYTTLGSHGVSDATGMWELSFDLFIQSGTVRITYGSGNIKDISTAGQWMRVVLCTDNLTTSTWLSFFTVNGVSYWDNVKLRRVLNGTHGRSIGSLEAGQPAHPYAYKFDGVNDYVDFGNTLNVNKYDVLLFGWVYFLNSGSGWKVLLEKGYEYTIAVNEDTNTIVGNSGTGSAWNGNIASAALTPGWYFATFVIKNTYRALFLNGVISNSDLLANTGNGALPLRWGSANGANYQNSSLGLTGLYLFDGQNGAPDALPADYENWIRRIYNSTKDRYNSSLPKVSLNKAIALKTWTPDLHKSALRLMVDPYRQQKAGWANARNDKAVIDYSKGGIITESGFKDSELVEVKDGYVWSGGTVTVTHQGNNLFTVEADADATGGRPFFNLYNPIPVIPKAIKIAFKDYYDIDSVTYVSERRLLIRFRKADGTYVTDTDWSTGIPGFTWNSVYGAWYAADPWTLNGNEYVYYLRDFPPAAWASLSISIGANATATAPVYKKIYDFYVESNYNAEIGIMNGGLESTAWGAHEAAMAFDAVNDYVNFGTGLNGGSSDRLFSVWINPPTTGWAEAIIGKHKNGGNYDGFYIRRRSDNRFEIWISDANGSIGAWNIFTGYTIVAAQFVNLSIAVSEGSAKLYINGNLIQTLSISKRIGDSTTPYYMGTYEVGSQFMDSLLGIVCDYAFDAQNGAPALLPFDYENIIREIYNNSKHLYNAALPDVPMLDITTPEPWTPVLHKEALKLLVDPYRQHLAGQNIAKPNKLITDYSGSVVLGSELVTDGDMETAGISGWVSVGSPTSVAKDTTTFNSGSQSIKVVTTTTQTGITRNVTTVIGKLYQVTQYVKCSNNIYIGVVGSGWDNLLTINTYGKWEKFTYTFKATATNTALRMQTDGSTTNATFWGDDFSVKEISGGNHGIATGSLELTGWQKEWGGVKFDGVNDVVDFGNVLDVGANDFIVSTWVNLTDTVGPYELISKRNSSDGYRIYFQTGAIRSMVNGAAGSTDATMSAGVWEMWTLVKSGEDLFLYKNASLSGSANNAAFASVADSSQNLRIGAYQGSTNWLKGLSGISGIYLFDGQDGAASALPADYEDIITEIYENTRDIYGV